MQLANLSLLLATQKLRVFGCFAQALGLGGADLRPRAALPRKFLGTVLSNDRGPPMPLARVGESIEPMLPRLFLR